MTLNHLNGFGDFGERYHNQFNEWLVKSKYDHFVTRSEEDEAIKLFAELENDIQITDLELYEGIPEEFCPPNVVHERIVGEFSLMQADTQKFNDWMQTINSLDRKSESLTNTEKNQNVEHFDGISNDSDNITGIVNEDEFCPPNVIDEHLSDEFAMMQVASRANPLFQTAENSEKESESQFKPESSINVEDFDNKSDNTTGIEVRPEIEQAIFEVESNVEDKDVGIEAELSKLSILSNNVSRNSEDVSVHTKKPIEVDNSDNINLDEVKFEHGEGLEGADSTEPQVTRGNGEVILRVKILNTATTEHFEVSATAGASDGVGRTPQVAYTGQEVKTWISFVEVMHEVSEEKLKQLQKEANTNSEREMATRIINRASKNRQARKKMLKSNTASKNTQDPRNMPNRTNKCLYGNSDCSFLK